MKVNDFIRELKRVEKLPTLYKLGTFMNRQSGRYILCDCSGLIKGILWGYPEHGKYRSNGVPDYNANTIINKCKNVSSNFYNIKVGEFVWMDGHCGVYIGNDQVIESSPKWENGIQITKLEQRKWLKHGFLPWIDYSTVNTKEAENVTVQEAYIVIAKEVLKGTYGNGHDKRKEAIYKEVRKEVSKMS